MFGAWRDLQLEFEHALYLLLNVSDGCHNSPELAAMFKLLV
jgi:hypothetical protein